MADSMYEKILKDMEEVSSEIQKEVRLRE